MRRIWTEFIAGEPIPDWPDERVWVNNLYQVVERALGSQDGNRFVHLSIKRVDREALHDWRDLQRIKNEIVGPEAEAVELYPAESRLVDNANQYHLWCIIGSKYPLGFTQGRMLTEAQLKDGHGFISRQRPWPDGERPRDLMSHEEAQRRVDEWRAGRIAKKP